MYFSSINRRDFKMALKKHVLNLFYNLTGKYSRLKKSPRRFMNLGYISNDALRLKESDQADKNFINLYHELLRDIDLKEKSVLEVGCGRGGGCYYMDEYRSVKKAKGIDLSGANITICNEANSSANVLFVEADAERFSFNEELFDVVINLESSHCYNSKKDFFSCVYKALDDDGLFMYGDLFEDSYIKKIEKILTEAGFVIEAQKEITAGVVDSLDVISDIQYPFTSKYPWMVPRFIKNIMVSKGSDVYHKLKDRTAIYKCYTLRKSKL